MRHLPPIAYLFSLVLSAGACGEAGWAGEGPEAAARTGEACAMRGRTASCGEQARSFCDEMSDPEDLQWGPCLSLDTLECSPGEVVDSCEGGQVRCKLFGGVPYEDRSECDENFGPITPLVLRFDDAAVRFQSVPNRGVVNSFDINGDGACTTTDWPSAHTPWLALDRDGDGKINSGTELFGSGTMLVGGAKARNGFEALAQLDSDGDGSITRADERFDELRLWGDVDADRMGAGAELQSLQERGVERIDLDFHVNPLCDARGNCEVERARFIMRDASGQASRGEVVDVHLGCQG